MVIKIMVSMFAIRMLGFMVYPSLVSIMLRRNNSWEISSPDSLISFSKEFEISAALLIASFIDRLESINNSVQMLIMRCFVVFII